LMIIHIRISSDAWRSHIYRMGALLFAKSQASAGVLREVAAQLQAEKAAAAEATEIARHDACALRQPDEPPAVEVGSHLEVLVLIEEPKEDGSISKEYS